MSNEDGLEADQVEGAAEEKAEEDLEYCKRQELFTQAGYTAWFTVSIEKIKQLLWLSAGAIGLLLSLRESIDDDSRFLFWILALLCFGTTLIITVLFSFDNACKVIADTIKGAGANSTKIAKRLDLGAGLAFLAGVVLSIILVVLTMNISLCFSNQ